MALKNLPTMFDVWVKPFLFDLQLFEDPDPNDPNPDPEIKDPHAARVIAKANAEAKKHRLAAEAAAEQAKKTADELAELKNKLADAEKAELEKNNKFKELAEKLAIEKAEADRALAAEKEANAKALAERDKAREQDAIKDAVAKAAIKAGIIDEDLVELFDVSTVVVKDGKVDKTTVDALIEAKKTEKPKLFEEPTQPQRNADGTFSRPDPKKGANKDLDWSKLTPEEFAQKERELVRKRA